MRRFLSTLACVALFAACAPTTPPDRAILVIGDSVMAWNGDRGIPEALGAALGRPVTDAAQSGAHLTHPRALMRALGFDISAQVRPGSWDWIALTGGGNDLLRLCGTPQAASVRDSLIGPELDGEVPALIAKLRASGARVAVVGYYDAARAAPTVFTPCQPEFDVMNARTAQLAATDPGLVFVDAGDVIDPSDLSLYDPDRIHPSPDGSVRIAAALARAIRAAEQ